MRTNRRESFSFLLKIYWRSYDPSRLYGPEWTPHRGELGWLPI
jgi:hypothetical protein